MNKYIEQSQKAFDKQTPQYDTSCYSRHAKASYDALLSALKELSYHTLLDLGCGTGEILFRLYQYQPAAQYYGIDLSKQMLAQARRKLQDHALLTCGDSASLPYPDSSMDVILCNDSFHHYPFPLMVMHEIYRVLKPNGTFILCDLYARPIQRFFMNRMLSFTREGDVHIYNEQEILSLFTTTGFQISSFQRIQKDAFMAKALK